ncbi:MAG TPA: hypothetical protein VLM85_08600 [Polyangiaceae bacterium]|nr:hypothetical protein [Polyangiaceae bacterium]
MWTQTRFDRAVLAALALSLALPVTPARAQEETNLAGYRERFKQGLDHYEEGDVAGALSFWEPLYRDLGPARGYRVGYNLARAYEVVGDATRAAERYESFLVEVAARQKAGEELGPLVAHDATQARARLDELAKTRGRIRVAGAIPPVSVRIDGDEPRISGFVAYVAPGSHDVVFAPGTADERHERVDAQAGEVVDVAPPEPPPLRPLTIAPPREALPATKDRVVHPFGVGWLWAAGAATLLGGVFTAGAYANAVAIHDRYAPPYPTTQTEVDAYDGARTLAYASWAVPAAFAVTTAVLVGWYLLGKKSVRVTASGGVWAF